MGYLNMIIGVEIKIQTSTPYLTELFVTLEKTLVAVDLPE